MFNGGVIDAVSSSIHLTGLGRLLLCTKQARDNFSIPLVYRSLGLAALYVGMVHTHCYGLQLPGRTTSLG